MHYPERFESLTEARRWMRRFVAWYNHEHRHSGIAMLPPAAVHTGAATAQLAARQTVLDAMRPVPPIPTALSRVRRRSTGCQTSPTPTVRFSGIVPRN